MQFRRERQTVVDLCLDLSHRGHFSGTGGNIALRVDPRHIAVTPSATDYFSMTAEDVCILRLDDLHVVAGERSPSVETGLHARVLRARGDVGCSIHTHQPIASACALIGKALDVPVEWRAALGPRVPVAGYAPSGSDILSRLLGRQVRRDVNAYLMRNHGAVCCGATPEIASRNVDALEALALAHLRRLVVQRLPAGGDRPSAQRRLLDALATSSPH